MAEAKTTEPTEHAKRLQMQNDLLDRVASHSLVQEADSRVETAESLLLYACKENHTDEQVLEAAQSLKKAWNNRCRQIAAVVDATRGIPGSIGRAKGKENADG